VAPASDRPCDACLHNLPSLPQQLLSGDRHCSRVVVHQLQLVLLFDVHREPHPVRPALGHLFPHHSVHPAVHHMPGALVVGDHAAPGRERFRCGSVTHHRGASVEHPCVAHLLERPAGPRSEHAHFDTTLQPHHHTVSNLVPVPFELRFRPQYILGCTNRASHLHFVQHEAMPAFEAATEVSLRHLRFPQQKQPP
jgi:hypothetical protein